MNLQDIQDVLDTLKKRTDGDILIQEILDVLHEDHSKSPDCCDSVTTAEYDILYQKYLTKE